MMKTTMLGLAFCFLVAAPGYAFSIYLENDWNFDSNGLLSIKLRAVAGLGAYVWLPTYDTEWIVLMQRTADGKLDFNRNWDDYKNGFGDMEHGEFWIGNEIISRLTSSRKENYTLRIEIEVNSNGKWYMYVAEYAIFYIEPEANNYALHVSGYSGNAGDSLAGSGLSQRSNQNGQGFTTQDSGQDRGRENCAKIGGGGWWYNACYEVNACLTCKGKIGFAWDSSIGSETTGQLQAARMMMKKN